MSQTVTVVPYDPNWARMFEREQQSVVDALAGVALDIEHIGSTAIPGIVAKPILDMMVAVAELLAVGENQITALQQIGYVYRGDAGVLGRHFFKKETVEITYHLHVTVAGGGYWEEKILFRDYLRRHREAAKVYEELKLGLAAQYQEDRSTYTKCKGPFVEEILAKARAERGIGMRIAVISDTHMPKKAKQLPQALRQGLANVDYILHAGDWQTLALYEELSQFAPVDGVAGNVDGEEIVERFGRKKVLTFGGVRIGLVHGDGTGKTTEKRAIDAFVDEKVDLIIFGHSHIPLVKEHQGVILFNPGSATDKRRQPQFSYGLITIGGELKIEHIYYTDKS